MPGTRHGWHCIAPLLGLALAGARPAGAAQYFIDCANGSDAHAGTSKSTAWRHHPYMAMFSGRFTHSPGDRFYFKGGVTCPGSDFPLIPQRGGTAAAPDYYGIDPSWHAGATWSRPIFDSGRANIGSDPAAANYNVEIDFDTYQPRWITIDNIEFTGHYWSGNYRYGQNVTIKATAQQDGLVVKNSYFHGWSHGPLVPGEAQQQDSYNIVIGTTRPSARTRHRLIENSVFSGADSSDATDPRNIAGARSGSAVYYWQRVTGSVFTDLSNAIHGAVASVDNNSIANIRNSYDRPRTVDGIAIGGTHSNAVEVWTVPSIAANYVYNNVVHDTGSGVLPIDVGSWRNAGKTAAYVFNNVLWNTAWGPSIGLDPNCAPRTACNFAALSFYLWNNTLVVPDGNSCVRAAYRMPSAQNAPQQVIGTIEARNNLCIGDAGGDSILAFDAKLVAAKRVESNDVMLTNAAAARQGFAATSAFVPIAPDSPTLAAGANLTALCGAARLPALCADIRGEKRPAAGNWNAGAYQHAP